MNNENNNLNTWAYDDGRIKIVSLASRLVMKDEISLEETAALTYSLIIDGETKGTIELPSILQNAEYDADTDILTLTFETTTGEKTIDVSLKDLVDLYEAGDGLSLGSKVFSVKVDGDSDEYLTVSANGVKLSGVKEAITSLNETVATVNENVVTAINTINQNVADAINTINGGIDNEIRPAIAANTEAIEAEVTRATEAEEANAATIKTVNDNLVSSIETINSSIATVNQNLVDAVNTINGGLDNEIRPAIEANTSAIEAEVTRATEAEEKNAATIKTVNDNLVSSIETINTSISTVNQNLVDAVNTINGGIDNEIRPVIESNTAAIEAEVTRATAAEDNLLAQFDLINLEGEGLEYKLTVGDRLAGTITIPEDQFLKSVTYNADATTLTLVFTTSEGEQTVNVDLSGLIDTYVAGNGLALDSNSFSINIASDSEGYLTVSENGLKVAGIDEIKTNLESEITRATAAEEANSTAITDEATRATNAETELQSSITALQANLDSEVTRAKAAEEANAANITTNSTAITTEATARTEADDQLQASITTLQATVDTKANSEEVYTKTEADAAFQPVGSYATSEELTTLEATVDTKANSTDVYTKTEVDTALAAKANTSDIPSLDGYATEAWVTEQGYLTEHQDISALATKAEVTTLETTVTSNTADIATNKTAIETEATARTEGDETNAASVVSLDALLTAISDKFSLIENRLANIVKSSSTSVENYDGTETLSDSAASYYIDSAAITNTATITASSVTLADSTLSNDARLKITSNDVEVSNLTVSGDFPKSTSNAIVSVNNAETLSFTDTTFDLSDSYNAVEIGLSTSSSTLPKNIVFDNCSFVNSVGNNAILIFGTQDNATITLNNCSFEKVSNVLRLSNRTNATGVTVNVVNCTVGQWETSSPWQGFLCLQDYTSTSNEEVISNNLFAPEKITINFINLTYQGTKYAPTDVTALLGTKADDQFGIIYANNYTDDTDGFRAYDSDIYPTITFK